jgi:hypothetical protein
LKTEEEILEDLVLGVRVALANLLAKGMENEDQEQVA